MTLFEAYESAFNERNDKLKGRYKTDFSYWKNGTGPSEQNQIKTLIKLGYTQPNIGVWKMPENGFKNLHLITISIESGGFTKLNTELLANGIDIYAAYYIRIGAFYKVHIAGPKEGLEKISKKFDFPN